MKSGIATMLRLSRAGCSVVVAVGIGLHLMSQTLGQTQTPTSPGAEATAPSQATNGVAQSGAASGDAPAVAPTIEQSYAGTNQCFVCHRSQANAWSETNHAHAFTHLAEKYRDDVACLNCHVTGFGQPGGFVVGTDKDLLMVGCESCHGPGARHIDAAQRFDLATPAEEAKIEQEMRATIAKTPPDSVCIACHITQAHGLHPPYEDTLPAPATTASAGRRASRPAAVRPSISTVRTPHYVSGYSVKTCGSCHYDHYQQWRAEKHSTLTAMVPAKYLNDQECQNCHVRNDALLTSSILRDDPQRSRIGLVCESCHGAALEHVRFNVRYIHGPRLGPQLELAARQSIRKGRLPTACVQCHVRQGHKQHPPFDEAI
jgi:hypothetical protein